ncbi:MAG: hypothetical protein JO304_25730 [Solirubrobacterales bacterium]|nr:hypothetical protein [Solirubrobacterales bacterium]
MGTADQAGVTTTPGVGAQTESRDSIPPQPTETPAGGGGTALGGAGAAVGGGGTAVGGAEAGGAAASGATGAGAAGTATADAGAARAGTTGDGAAGTATGDAAPLLSAEASTSFQQRWEEVQTRFVDEPRGAVEEADGLVANLMQQLAEGFAQERERLEAQWGRGEDISTEDLRVALQRYRSFFHRLLSA